MVIVEGLAWAGMAEKFTEIRKHDFQIHSLIHPDVHSSDNHCMAQAVSSRFPVAQISIWSLAPDRVKFVGYSCFVNVFLRIQGREKPNRLITKEMADICIVVFEFAQQIIWEINQAILVIFRSIDGDDAVGIVNARCPEGTGFRNTKSAAVDESEQDIPFRNKAVLFIGALTVFMRDNASA